MSLPFGDSTVLGTSLAHLLDGGFSRAVVVLGPDMTLEALTRGAAAPSERVLVVKNPTPSRGMLSSIQAGASTLAPEEHFAVALGDQPGISASTIRRLLRIFLEQQPDVLRPRWGGKRGHPVFFRAPLRQALLDLPEGSTLRDLVYAFPALEVEVETDEIHRDIDTPDDYALEMARAGALPGR